MSRGEEHLPFDIPVRERGENERSLQSELLLIRTDGATLKDSARILRWSCTSVDLDLKIIVRIQQFMKEGQIFLFYFSVQIY